MVKLTSLEQIQDFIRYIKSFKKGFITNLYLDPFKHSIWIEDGEFFGIENGETVLLFHRTSKFTSLFYISTNIQALQESLSEEINSDSTELVVDLVGNESVSLVKDAFISLGFTTYTTLHRMSRIGKPEGGCLLEESQLKEAIQDDGPLILNLLNSYFDAYSEQIPSIKEIQRWISLGQILVYKESERILGFLIYDFQGGTLYLRYWFVHPEFRDKKIGSKLFNYFFYKGRDSKRQLFWVIDTNENAIKRYKHYGFVSEKMYDYVLLKNS